jgi:putative nucleotidyltransferase with HDIG domain
MGSCAEPASTSFNQTGAIVTTDQGSGERAADGWIDPADVFQPLLIESVVAGIRNLPTLPSVAAYLLNHVDEDVHLPQVIQMLSYDQVMTARILRFANSAYVGSPTPPKTVNEAINRIGLNALREMVCISAVSGLMVPDRCPDFELRVFWRHSVAAACCASSLARTVGANAAHAFTAGLLHDVGRMVLACAFPAEYSRTLRYQADQACTVVEAEHATIGIDHVQTGLELSRRWQLADDLQEAIAHHHAATVLEAPMPTSLPPIVYLANLIGHAVDLSDGEDIGSTTEIQFGLLAIGLSDDEYPQVLTKAKTAYRAAIEALSL